LSFDLWSDARKSRVDFVIWQLVMIVRYANLDSIHSPQIMVTFLPYKFPPGAFRDDQHKSCNSIRAHLRSCGTAPGRVVEGDVVILSSHAVSSFSLRSHSCTYDWHCPCSRCSVIIASRVQLKHPLRQRPSPPPNEQETNRPKVRRSDDQGVVPDPPPNTYPGVPLRGYRRSRGKTFWFFFFFF
jgi:hypothetical protein